MTIIMHRVMNDMVNGTVRLLGALPERHEGERSVSPGSKIDFQSYIQEYQLCMLMAGFAAWCGTLQPPQETIVKPTAEDVHVFGGS